MQSHICVDVRRRRKGRRKGRTQRPPPPRTLQDEEKAYIPEALFECGPYIQGFSGSEALCRIALCNCNQYVSILWWLDPIRRRRKWAGLENQRESLRESQDRGFWGNREHTRSRNEEEIRIFIDSKGSQRTYLRGHIQELDDYMDAVELGNDA